MWDRYGPQFRPFNVQFPIEAGLSSAAQSTLTPTSTMIATQTLSPSFTPTITPSPIAQYPCEAEIIGRSQKNISFYEIPSQGDYGEKIYLVGDRVVITKVSSDSKWYFIQELNGVERRWARDHYFSEYIKKSK